jgi:DNA-binding PucR family transcriptional regulator
VQFGGSSPVVASLVDRATADVPALVAATLASLLAELPAYRDGTPVDHAALEDSVERNLAAAVRALRGATPPDLDEAARTGRQRARQGAPLHELVRAYRIGLTELWRAVLAQLEDGRPGDLDALAEVTVAVWALADEYATAATDAYRAAASARVAEQQARRSAMVEALLTGSAAAEGTLWDIGRVLGLVPDGDFVVVAAETLVLGQEPLPGVEAELRRRTHASAWRLTPDLQAGVVSLRDPRATADLVELVGGTTSARVGISPAFRGLGSTARALHLARVALSTLPRGRGGAVQFTDSPLAGLVASSPEASGELAHQVLGPLLALDGDERNVLLLTLRGWFACQGSTALTAERMFCHPNTVRGRLRRITEVLGRGLGDPEHVAALGAALRALDLFPAAEHLAPTATTRPEPGAEPARSPRPTAS